VQVPHGWSGAVYPIQSGKYFDPIGRFYINVVSDIRNQDYETDLAYPTITGFATTASGDGITCVTMEGLPRTPLTNSDGFYAAKVSSSFAGSVVPVKSGYTFYPQWRTYNGVGSGFSGQNYTGTAGVSITGVAPGNGPPGTRGLITGVGFGTQQGTVRFIPYAGPDTQWQVLSWSGTQVAFRVPEGTPAGTGHVQILHFDGPQSNEAPFEVTQPSTVHVDDGNATGLENGTEKHPFDTVAEGTRAVADGGTVKVASGTYNENTVLDGKAATVRGGYVGGTYPGTGDFQDQTRNADPSTNGTVIDGGDGAVVCQGHASSGSTLASIRIVGHGVTVRRAQLERVVTSSGGP